MAQDELVAESATEISPLMVGMSAPAFSLTAADGMSYNFDPETGFAETVFFAQVINSSEHNNNSR